MANAMTFGHRLEELTDGVTVFRDGVGKPMPLISTDFEINISSGLAVVVATRKFRNNEDVPIEAILTMPVGFNTVVTGLSAQIDGRKLRAIAKSKTVARAQYEDAIDCGKMAVLHEEVLRGVHVLSVGQLAPGREVLVELRTVLPLTLAGVDPFLRIPVTTGQLYGVTPLQPADDLITDRTVRHVASLQVRTDKGVPMLGGTAMEPGQTKEITLNKAIELVVVGGVFGSSLGTSASGHQVRLDLQPKQGGAQPLKLAVLVDRSGSTNSTLSDRSTTVLDAMKRGLAEALSNVQDDDYIALWQFSGECQRIGTGAGREVLQLLKKLSPPSGGTNLASAIQKVASSGAQQILVLTDGQTWDSLHRLAVQLNVRVSAVLVGKGSLDANIGHFCAMTGGDLYYAPDADVASSVRLALLNSRSGLSEKEIALEAGRPILVSRTTGGVDLSASWSDAMELGTGDDIGRFAASICLSMISETEGIALALAEGLCGHLTSLVLVDEAGAAADGLSETRKVPLMGEEEGAVSLVDVDYDDDSKPSDFIEDRNAILPMDSARPYMPQRVAPAAPRARFGISSLISRNSGAADDAVQRSTVRAAVRRTEAAAIMRLKSPMNSKHRLRSFLDADFLNEGEIGLESADLERLAQGIDWEGQSDKFLFFDFSGLLPEEHVVLTVILTDHVVSGVIERTGVTPRLVLLALIAKKFGIHSRRAQLLVAEVYRMIEPNIVEELDHLQKSE